MEHLLCECEHYSELLWDRLSSILMELFKRTSTDQVSWVELGQTNIIYNIPHPSILLHIPDKITRNTLLLLVQEVKRDIIYRRLNLPPSAQQIPIHGDSLPTWILPCRLHLYIRFIGFVKLSKASEVLAQLQEINKD
jgi:hypothetical protein